MLSPLATILFTWAAIYTYVGAYYCMLHARRPTHREYLAFGLLCFGLTTWSAGSALGVDARNLEEGAFAMQVQYIGGFSVVAFFADFASELSGMKRPAVVRACYVICGLGILADVFGVLFDPTQRAPAPTWGFAFAPRYIEPVLTPIGRVLVIGPLGFASWAVWHIARGTERQRDLRLFVWASSVTVLAGIHDTAIRIANMRSIYLLEHFGLVPVLAVSYTLLRRFVHAADELGKRTAELRRSYSELRVTQEELVRKEQLAAVGELSAVIAHEVRNPLAIIKNAVSSLRRPTLRATDRGVLLGILDEEVDRLNRLVRDLLAYARPVEPRGRPVHLGTLVRDVVQASLANHEGADAIGVTLEVARCPTIHGDPDLLRQALANVADNALQAMPNGGTLQVHAESVRRDDAPAVQITFADSGDGMDTLVLHKAKDPFFTTRAAGTGLGLAIVERVVKNHGGQLTIESRPGAGTTVTLVLPIERPSSTPPEPE